MKVIHLLRKPLSEGTVAANVLRHGTGALNIDASRVVTAQGDEVSTHPRSPEASAKENRPIYGEYGPLHAYQTEGQKLGRWPANLVLQHLDGCRQEGEKRVRGSNSRPSHIGKGREGDHTNGIYGAHASKVTTAYVDEDGTEVVAAWVCAPKCPVAALDAQSGTSKSSGGRIGNAQGAYAHQGRTGWGTGHTAGDPGFGDVGGASRFFKQVKA
jgi:site-specific DNA-methyltransferase (adenine-specific)